MCSKYIKNYRQKLNQYYDKNKDRVDLKIIALITWGYSAIFTYVVLFLVTWVLGIGEQLPSLVFGFSVMAISGIIAMISTYGIIPYHISLWVHRAIPLLITGGVLIFSLQFMINIGSLLIEYLSSIQIEYADALIITIGLTYLTSLSIFLNSLYSRPHRIQPHLDQNRNFHELLSKKLGLEFTPKQTETMNFPSFDTYRIETHNELRISAIIIFITLFIYWRILELAGVFSMDEISALVLILGLIMIIVLYEIPQSFLAHRTWRHFWLEYWNFIRLRMLSRNSILNELPPPSFSIASIAMKQNEELEYELEAQKLAILYKFEDFDEKNTQHMAYIDWYHRTKNKVERLSEDVLSEVKILSEFKSEFESLGTSFHIEKFPNLVRKSFILDARRLFLRIPGIIDVIARTYDWNSPTTVNNIDSAEILEIAIERIEALRNMPAFPIPNSIKWLFAVFVLSLTLLPYFIAFGLAMIVIP